jgi:hypothetical protein
MSNKFKDLTIEEIASYLEDPKVIFAVLGEDILEYHKEREIAAQAVNKYRVFFGGFNALTIPTVLTAVGGVLYILTQGKLPLTAKLDIGIEHLQMFDLDYRIYKEEPAG